jgi:hypothetical protein
MIETLCKEGENAIPYHSEPATDAPVTVQVIPSGDVPTAPDTATAIKPLYPGESAQITDSHCSAAEFLAVHEIPSVEDWILFVPDEATMTKTADCGDHAMCCHGTASGAALTVHVVPFEDRMIRLVPETDVATKRPSDGDHVTSLQLLASGALTPVHVVPFEEYAILNDPNPATATKSPSDGLHETPCQRDTITEAEDVQAIPSVEYAKDGVLSAAHATKRFSVGLHATVRQSPPAIVPADHVIPSAEYIADEFLETATKRLSDGLHATSFQRCASFVVVLETQDPAADLPRTKATESASAGTVMLGFVYTFIGDAKVFISSLDAPPPPPPPPPPPVTTV